MIQKPQSHSQLLLCLNCAPSQALFLATGLSSAMLGYSNSCADLHVTALLTRAVIGSSTQIAPMSLGSLLRLQEDAVLPIAAWEMLSQSARVSN